MIEDRRAPSAHASAQTTPAHRLHLFCALAALVFLVYCGLLAGRSVAGFPPSQTSTHRWPYLGDKPVGEDGYYMLSVADNLASTHHLVYTYNMPATGIQPLATLVFAAIAVVTNHLGGDRWTLIRAVLFFGCCLFVLFSWIVARFAASLAPPQRRALVFTLAFFLVLCDFTLFRLFTYGLETGFYLVAMACCLVLWHTIVTARQRRWRPILLLGIAGGFAGLARIDFGLVFAILLAFLLGRRLASFLQVGAAGLLALLITSPWFLFVHSVSGAWLPSSGKAESHFIRLADTSRVTTLLVVTIGHIVPWVYVAANNIETLTLGILSLSVLFLAWQRAPQLRASLAPGGALRGTFLPWAIGVALLSCIYLLLFWSTHFYQRYLSPIVLLSIPLLALALSELRFVQRRPAAILSALVLFFCAWDLASLHGGHVGNAFLLNAGYIRQNFANARVGAFQSGTMAYFNPNIENLDGKLNQGALIATQKNELAPFLDAERIDVLFDSPGYIHLHLSDEYLQREWQPCTPPMPIAGWMCLTRKTVPAN